MKHDHEFEGKPVGFEPLPPHPWWVVAIKLTLEITALLGVLSVFGWLFFNEM